MVKHGAAPSMAPAALSRRFVGRPDCGAVNAVRVRPAPAVRALSARGHRFRLERPVRRAALGEQRDDPGAERSRLLCGRRLRCPRVAVAILSGGRCRVAAGCRADAAVPLEARCQPSRCGRHCGAKTACRGRRRGGRGTAVVLRRGSRDGAAAADRCAGPAPRADRDLLGYDRPALLQPTRRGVSFPGDQMEAR